MPCVFSYGVIWLLGVCSCLWELWTKRSCRGGTSEAWTGLGEWSVLNIPASASYSLIHIPLPVSTPPYFSHLYGEAHSPRKLIQIHAGLLMRYGNLYGAQGAVLRPFEHVDIPRKRQFCWICIVLVYSTLRMLVGTDGNSHCAYWCFIARNIDNASSWRDRKAYANIKLSSSLKGFFCENSDPS